MNKTQKVHEASPGLVQDIQLPKVGVVLGPVDHTHFRESDHKSHS